MHHGEAFAQGATMFGLRPVDAYTVKKRDNSGRSSGQMSQRLAVAAVNRDRTSNTCVREVLHEAEEKWQVFGIHSFLIQGQYVMAGTRVQEIIRVFDALGNALAGQELADVIFSEEGMHVLVRYNGVNRHAICPELSAKRAWEIESNPF